MMRFIEVIIAIYEEKIMGRQSNLTEMQWQQLGQRMLAGERLTDLAKEYGVSKTSISIRFSKRNETLKGVAKLVLESKTALGRLTIPEQIAVHKQVDILQTMQNNLLSAANYGASTAHKASMQANRKMDELDDSRPLSDDDNLTIAKDVMMLTKMANESSVIARDMLSDRNQRKAEEKQVIKIEGGFDV
jgi:hypothetical protein